MSMLERGSAPRSLLLSIAAELRDREVATFAEVERMFADPAGESRRSDSRSAFVAGVLAVALEAGGFGAEGRAIA